MSHLQEENMTYFQHLRRAWGLAFICLVHGLFPNVWKHKASEILNENI